MTLAEQTPPEGPGQTEQNGQNGQHVAAQDARAQALALTGAQIVWTLSPDGTPQDVAPEWCAYTGQSYEQAAGAGALDAVHPDDLANNLATVERALAERRPYQVQCRIRRHDGVYQTFLLRATPIHTVRGRLRQWVGTLTNVTEYEEALRDRAVLLAQEAELSQASVRAARRVQVAEKRFRRLVDAKLIGILLADEERIFEANDAFLRIVGYSRDDLEAGRICWREMTPPEYLPRDERGIAELLERGECTPFEKEYVRQDGSRVPILIGATLLEREPLQWVCFVVDLTERKRLERELAARVDEAQASQQRLAETLESVTDGFYALDAEWRFTYLNAQAERLLRRTREELLGKCLWDEFPEAVSTPFYDAYQRVVRERMPVVIEDYYPPLDLWVEIRVYPAPDGGLAAYFLDVGERKCTEAERARLLADEQRARAEAEAVTARLQAVLDVLPVGVVIADADGRMVAVNGALRAIWAGDATSVDVPLAEAVAGYGAFRAWWSATGEPLAPHDWAMARALRHGETSVAEELDIETFDGTRKTILHSGAPIRDEAGHITGGVTAMLDITERKRLERAVAEQAAQLQTTFEALGDALFVYDAEGQLLQVNAAGRALLGLDAAPEYAAGHQAQDLGPQLELRDDTGEALPTERWPLFRALRGETLTGSSAADVVFRALDDGRETYTAVSAAPLRDAQGAIRGAVLAIRDVTERRRLEAQLAMRAAELEATNQHMDDFLHLVTHELRTPLTSLKGNLQMAARRLRRAQAATSVREPMEPEPGPGQPDLLSAEHWNTPSADGEAGVPVHVPSLAEPLMAQPWAAGPAGALELAYSLLQRADQQVARLSRLLDDLTDASRVRTGKLELRRAPCDLAALVRQCVEEQRRLSKRPIRLHLHVPAGAGAGCTVGAVLPVVADVGRIEQVLTNYLTNAVKYSPPEMPIEVTLSTTMLAPEEAGLGHTPVVAHVAVRDQGRGLTLEEQQHVWERLRQVERIRAEGGTGSGGAGLGLGLYISRSIVEGHGGAVGVKSVVGVGSTFWFTLPLAPQADAATTPAPTPKG